MTPDVKVLVAASRSDHPHHGVARAWLEEAISASRTGPSLTLMPMVLASFLRLVPSPKIRLKPCLVTEPPDFFAAVRSLLFV